MLTDLLRLIAPAAARVTVNRANVPSADEEIAGFWVETLTAQASEEARLLSVAFASAKGDPAVIVLPNEAQALAFLRALSAVRLALRDLVFRHHGRPAGERRRPRRRFPADRAAPRLGLLRLLRPAPAVAHRAADPRSLRLSDEIG